MDDDTASRTRISRRHLLASVGVGLGAIGGYSSRGRTQTTGTGQEAQIRTRAIVPRVGEPYRGQYVGQFVLFTDPTPNDEVSPAIVGECGFADWEQSETRGYQGLLVDRLTDEPRGVEIPMYLSQNEERVDVGEAFIVDTVQPCGEEFLGFELEAAPVERFQPDYSTVENPLVGEEPGPTVSPATDGDATGPGQSGLGAVATVLGIGGAGLLGKLVLDRTE